MPDSGSTDGCVSSSSKRTFPSCGRCRVESDTALEVNTSGLRQAAAETYPGPGLVAHFRELGGTRLTAGSDAHREHAFAFGLDAGYRVASEAGFGELSFRRGGGPVAIPIPDRARA